MRDCWSRVKSSVNLPLWATGMAMGCVGVWLLVPTLTRVEILGGFLLLWANNICEKANR